MASLRDNLARHAPIVILVAIVVIGASMVMSFRTVSRAPAPAVVRHYYVDLNTGSLFTATLQDPPIPSPSGGNGVLAHVFSCGSCDQESDRFVAYVTTFGGRPVPGFPHGDRISPAKSPYQWIPVNSPDAEGIKQSALKQCERPQECRP